MKRMKRKNVLISIILLTLTVGFLFFFINEEYKLSKLKLVAIYDIAIERQPFLLKYYFANNKMPQKPDDLKKYIDGNLYSRSSLQKIFDLNLGVPSEKGLNVDEVEKLIFEKMIEIGEPYQIFWNMEIACLKSEFNENISDIEFLDYFLNPRFHPYIFYNKILTIREKYGLKNEEEIIGLCYDCLLLKVQPENKDLQNEIKMQIETIKIKIQQSR